MLFLHQVVPGTEGHQMGVVGGCWDGHGPSTSDVGVTQLVGQHLELVSVEVIIVPQYMVVGRSAGSLQTHNIQNVTPNIHL